MSPLIKTALTCAAFLTCSAAAANPYTSWSGNTGDRVEPQYEQPADDAPVYCMAIGCPQPEHDHTPGTHFPGDHVPGGYIPGEHFPVEEKPEDAHQDEEPADVASDPGCFYPGCDGSSHDHFSSKELKDFLERTTGDRGYQPRYPGYEPGAAERHAPKDEDAARKTYSDALYRHADGLGTIEEVNAAHRRLLPYRD